MVLNAELQLRATEESLVLCIGKLESAETEIESLTEEVQKLKAELQIHQEVEKYNLNGFIYLDLVRLKEDSSKVHKLIKLTASVNEYSRFIDSVFTEDNEYVSARFLDYAEVQKFKQSIRKAVLKNEEQLGNKAAG